MPVYKNAGIRMQVYKNAGIRMLANLGQVGTKNAGKNVGQPWAGYSPANLGQVIRAGYSGRLFAGQPWAGYSGR